MGAGRPRMVVMYQVVMMPVPEVIDPSPAQLAEVDLQGGHKISRTLFTLPLQGYSAIIIQLLQCFRSRL